MTRQLHLLLPAVLLLILTACQPTQPIETKPDTTAETQAMAAEQSGDYLAAAQQYSDLANAASGARQAQYYLHAAQAYFQINQLDHVSATLANIDKSMLSEAQQLDAAILEADIALSFSQAEQALAALAAFQLRDATPTQQLAAYQLKVNAYELTENWLEKANAHIALASLLSNGEAIADNQQTLWQTLLKLTPQALELFNPGIAPAVDSGWFALAYIVRAYQTNPDALIVAIEDWQRNYPNHPADTSLYKELLKTGTRLPKQLNDIAILLPNSGPYAAAADAIRQGIIAAHFDGQTSTRLHFFTVETDTQSGTSNVWQQYQQAVSKNANLVIGPLDKVSVQVLADAEELPIPVLALNRLNDLTQKDNLFQFGLAPEDDAIAAANFAITQNYERAVVLAPTGGWGNRVASAFSEQWLANGGTLLSRSHYDENQSDFSTVIKPLLDLDASKQRQQKLKQTLGLSIEFEPRRRQDIDFLFLVARPLKARQLVPQLKFHRSGQLPVIATSHAYSGQENSQQDIDLNGLIINDIPWVFADSAMADPAYLALQNSTPQHFDNFIRLYALGADAYRLIPNLNSLSRSSELSFIGATGVLSIDKTGHLTRETRWAKFKRGKIKALPATTALPSSSENIIQ
ncbi:LppC family lipoprotein [Methylophaga sp. 42_25_T18]|nr:LppC family lipoprotein [Methylophaga sp. 42_25_T18]OUR87835.1 LppC family lipoprotein [Methylophaga sp. 42_8_T64]